MHKMHLEIQAGSQWVKTIYEVLFEPYRYIQSLMQLRKGFYPIFRGLGILHFILFDYSTLASPAHDTHTAICFVFYLCG